MPRAGLALPLLLLGSAGSLVEARLGGNQMVASVQRHQQQEAGPLDEKLYERLHSNDYWWKGKDAEFREKLKRTPKAQEVRYEMVTVYEEAYFEGKTLCDDVDGGNARLINALQNAKKGTGHGENLPADRVKALQDISLNDPTKSTNAKFISIGSSSTQVYSCDEYRGGFFSGWQPESWGQPEEIEMIAKWLAEDAAAEDPAKANQVPKEIVLMQNSALSSMVGPICSVYPDMCITGQEVNPKVMDEAKLKKVTAIQVWPEPKMIKSGACKYKEVPGLLDQALRAASLDKEAKDAIDEYGKQKVPGSPDPPDFRNRLEKVIGYYQEKFCSAGTKATVLLLGTKLENDWTKSMKRDANFAISPDEGVVVDWGGSGPKEPKKCKETEGVGAFPATWNNNFLVDPVAHKLDCNKLKQAITNIVKYLDKCKDAATNDRATVARPYLITQTGLARELWMKGEVKNTDNNGDCIATVKNGEAIDYEIRLASTPDAHLRPYIVSGITVANEWMRVRSDRAVDGLIQFSRNVSAVTVKRG